MQFEELTAGRVIKAGPRVVTQQEIVEFAERYDPQPFHVDAAAAAAGPWGGLIASGWMTCGIAMRCCCQHLNGSSCGSRASTSRNGCIR
jgi:acyl dehydratase